MDPETAARALGTLREGEDHVRRAARREQRLGLGARAVTTVLWLARKDLRDPLRRRVAGAAVMLGMAGLGAWEFKRSKVSTLWQERVIEQPPEVGSGDPERPGPGGFEDDLTWDERLRAMSESLTPAGKRLVVASAVAMVAQPLVVLGFRRSRVSYPNLAAGVVTAAMSTAIGLMRNRTAAADDAPNGELHDLLLDPTRLRIVAFVAPATSVRFRLIRDVTGLSDPALADQLQTLSDSGLVRFDPDRTGPARPRTWIRLTGSGRQGLTAHAAALTEIVGKASPAT